MTLNLFDLTYEVATELGILNEAAATGGTTTTLIDTVSLTQPDDYWNKGTVWVIYDVGAAGATPEGTYTIVSDFDNTSNTATVGTIVAPAAGDRYAIADEEFPLQMLIQAVNKAIRDAGDMQVDDITSLDTAAAKTEYSLPTAASTDLREVWIQTKLNDANDFRWVELTDWKIQRTAVGTGDLLILGQQPPTSRDLKLVYMAPHVSLNIYSDKLSESIHLERVVYRGAMHALKDYRKKTKDNTEWVKEAIDDYERLAATADIRHPIWAPKRKSKVMVLDWQVKETDKAPGGFA